MKDCYDFDGFKHLFDFQWKSDDGSRTGRKSDGRPRQGGANGPMEGAPMEKTLEDAADPGSAGKAGGLFQAREG